MHTDTIRQPRDQAATRGLSSCSLAAQWALTAVFAAAGLTAALPRRDPAGVAQPAERISNVFCSVMCAALIVMTWRSEPAAVTWLQAALFGCVGLWFGLTSLAGFGQGRWPSRPDLFRTLMVGAVMWMLTAMPANTGMPAAGAARDAMAPMSWAATPAPVLVISILLAVSCAAASIPWLARAIAPGHRVKDPAAVSLAAMSAGMAAMLLATL
jgi:Domain of unknown function (DUF5134)